MSTGDDELVARRDALLEELESVLRAAETRAAKTLEELENLERTRGTLRAEITGTGNSLASGVLVEAANSDLRCEV